jgi:HrpA-like RNA helicase
MSKFVDIDVITTIRQTIEVPADYDKQDILNFLASQQSFNDAFKGLENDAYPGMTIREIEVIDEEFDNA